MRVQPSERGFPSGMPIGIVLIVVYSAFSGVLYLIAGVPPLFLAQFSGGLAFLGIVFIAVGVLLLAACYGLWSAQTWGINLAKGLYIVSIPLDIISMFVGPGEPSHGLVALTVVFVAAVVVLCYLFIGDVQDQFQ